MDDQVMVEDWPLAMVSGDAVTVTAGAGVAGFLVTVTLCDAVPPVPVHDTV